MVPPSTALIIRPPGRIRIAQLLNPACSTSPSVLSVSSLIGKLVTVCGWSRTVRKQGGGQLCFVALNDGSTVKSLQVVVEAGVENYEKLVKCGVGCSFKFIGNLIASPAEGQAVELSLKKEDKDHKVTIYGTVDQSQYPLAKKHHSREFLREIGHLRPRTLLIGAITRVRSELARATHRYFGERGFEYIHTPIITTADCEGAGELFQVTTVLPEKSQKCLNVAKVNMKKPVGGEDSPGTNTEAVAPPAPPADLYQLPLTKGNLIDYKKDFFGQSAFLTVSGQLAVENFCCGLSDVYTFGPTFRAENSHTSRHLAEFWMIEPELAFADLEDDMNCAEEYLKYCVKSALDNCYGDLEWLQEAAEKLEQTESSGPAKDVSKEKAANPKDSQGVEEGNGKTAAGVETQLDAHMKLIDRLKQIVGVPFGRLTYTEAVEKLAQYNSLFKEPVKWGVDLGSEHERFLTEKIYKKPVVVYNYPKDFKAFYMRLNDDQQTVAAMDVLLPYIGEVIGGSQREERLDVLDKMLEDKKLDKKPYWWYRELRKYGTIPHSGFGLGFERLVMLVTGVDNIRDVIPYPRFPLHAEF